MIEWWGEVSGMLPHGQEWLIGHLHRHGMLSELRCVTSAVSTKRSCSSAPAFSCSRAAGTHAPDIQSVLSWGWDPA